MKKKLLSALFVSLFLLSALTVVPKIYAQVVSGTPSNYFSILDIVMDSGGGSRESGTGADRVILKNTSIGQPTAGAYVVENTTGVKTLVVGGGHAYKADYCYDAGCQPTLQQLVATAGEDAVAQGNYKVSGLRADEEGGDYYNSLAIQPYISGNASDIEFSGAAFLEERPNVIAQSDTTPLPDLKQSADLSQGFIVMYINKNINIDGGPPIKTSGLGACGYNFCANNYYVYLGGQWSPPFDKNDRLWKTAQLSDLNSSKPLIVTATDLKVFNLGQHTPPLRPAFKAYFGKGLGNDKKWGTYGFVKTSTALGGSYSVAEPVPAPVPITPSTLNVSSIKATFYMFAIN